MEEFSLYKTVPVRYTYPRPQMSFILISKNYRKTVGGAPEAPM